MSKFLTPPSWYDKNGSEINIFDNTTYSSSGSENTAKNTAIGTSAIAGRPSGYGAVAVGYRAHAEGDASIAIGSYDKTGGGSSLNVEALADGSIAIGGKAKANADSTDGIAIGYGATSEHGGIAIGGYVDAASIGSIAIGNGARTGTNSNHGIAIGFGAISTMGGIAIGSIAYATANQIQLGNSDTAYTLNVGDGTGTSKIGALNFNEVASTDIQSNGLYLCTATKTQSGAGVTTTFGFSAFLWIETSGSTAASATDGSVTFTYSKSEGQSNWAIRVSGADSNTLKCYRVFSL